MHLIKFFVNFIIHFKNKTMAEQTTITKEEHFVLIDYYQNFIKNKEIEIQNLKKQLQFTLESKDVLEAKLEVLQNSIK